MRFKPMLAKPGGEGVSLVDPSLIYEPKYDGIRAIVEYEDHGPVIYSRDGNNKNQQFPEIIADLKRLKLDKGTVLDGEIVALDDHGNHTFQALQGRVHLQTPGRSTVKVGLALFDILSLGQNDLTAMPLSMRKSVLGSLLPATVGTCITVGAAAIGDGRAVYKMTRDNEWEGMVVKTADSTYQCGKRSGDWTKLKYILRQEFVVGGWTEGTGARKATFGALLLGFYPEGSNKLQHCGSVGTGWNEKELVVLNQSVRYFGVSRTENPFNDVPDEDRPFHYCQPQLVLEIKFNAWTRDGKLRHPVYMGVRDDKDPLEIRRES